MHSKHVPLIALAISLIGVLLLADNLQSAYALSLRSNQNIDVVTSLTTYGNFAEDDIFFYSHPLGVGGDMVFVDGETLNITADVDLGASNEVVAGALTSRNYGCSNSLDICAFSVLPVTNLRLAVFDMDDFSFAVFGETNATRAGCRIQALVNSGSGTTYGTVAGCTDASLDGIYQVNFGIIGQAGATGANVFILKESLPNLVDGVASGCYDPAGGFYVFSDVNTGIVRIYNPATSTLTSVDVGADADDVICDGDGFAITFADGDDEINVIDISTATIEATTSGLTNPRTGMLHLDNLFVSLTGSTSLTIYQYATDVAMTSIGTITGLNAPTFLVKGNATRLNALGITAGDLDVYAIEGLANDGSITVNESFCIDTNGDGDTDVCYVDTNGDGIPDTGGVLEVISNQNPPAEAIGRLLCQLGLETDCTDGQPTDINPATNGTGIILFFIMLVLMMASVGVALYGRIAVEFNLIVQVAVLMIATGLSVSFGWLEELWFFLMIFIIIGFASLAGAKFAMGRLRR